MKLLAWDTSSKSGAIAALEWDDRSPSARDTIRVAAEWSLNVDAGHSERLLWAVHEILEACRWKIEDVDLFGVGVGPGSFTGLRIGVTTARTLAHTLKRPLVGVSSLAALARPVALAVDHSAKANSSKGKTIVVAATDACKGELFALWGSSRSVVDCVAMAEGDRAGLWKRGVEEQVLSPDSLMKALKKKLTEGGKTPSSPTQWVVIGEGRARYLDEWKGLPKKQELELGLQFHDQVQGKYVGLLAWEAFQAGLAKDPFLVHPRYLRASDAELKLKAGLLPQGPTRGN